MTDPGEVVAAFIAAVERKDIEAAAAMLADDVSYENVPIAPIVGRDAARATLEAFLGPAEEVDWPVRRQVVSGRHVFNERLDRFRLDGGWLELPVAGVFEVDDTGSITLWRDYFDMATYTRQLEALTGNG